MSRFLARFYLGVANGTFKILGFGKFPYGLEISMILCHVSKSRLAGAFSVLDSRMFFFFSQGLGVSDTFVEYLEFSKFCLIKLVFI